LIFIHEATPPWNHRERRDDPRLLAWRDPAPPPAAIATRDDLEADPMALAHPRQEGATVASVGPFRGLQNAAA
jgi:hypothetical protein